MSTKIIDTQGLSCPQPLVLAFDDLTNKDNKSLEIYVDNEASKENICRAAKKHAWQIEIIEEEQKTKLILSR